MRSLSTGSNHHSSSPRSHVLAVEYASRVKTRWRELTRCALVVVVLAVGCEKKVGGGLEFIDPKEVETSQAVESLDAGVDAGCPDYPDGGTIQLIRGCPLTVRYGIK